MGSKVDEFDRPPEATTPGVTGSNGSKPAARNLHTFSNGATYAGEWLGQNRHGEGEQTWPDGGTYNGQWQNDKASGKGSFTYAEGDVYVGEWLDDKVHGH